MSTQSKAEGTSLTTNPVSSIVQGKHEAERKIVKSESKKLRLHEKKGSFYAGVGDVERSIQLNETLLVLIF